MFTDCAYRFLADVFGELEYDSRFLDTDQVLHFANNTSLARAIWESVQNINKRGRDMLAYRYGLRDGVWKTLEETGEHYRLTRERIRQILDHALRRVQQKDLLAFYRVNDPDFLEAVAAAVMRKAIYDQIRDKGGHSHKNGIMPEHVAFINVLRIRRSRVKDVYRLLQQGQLRLVNQVIASGCSVTSHPCAYCGDPALIGSIWCFEHVRFRSQVVMICDGCGKKVIKPKERLLHQPRIFHRSAYGHFCTRRCFYDNAHRLGIYKIAIDKGMETKRRKHALQQEV